MEFSFAMDGPVRQLGNKKAEVALNSYKLLLRKVCIIAKTGN